MCDAVALTGSTCADIVSSSEHERSDDDSAAHVNGSVTGYRSPAPVVSSLKRVHAKRDMPAAQGVRSHLAPIRQASISVPTRWALLLCLRSAVVVKVLQIMDTKAAGRNRRRENTARLVRDDSQMRYLRCARTSCALCQKAPKWAPSRSPSNCTLRSRAATRPVRQAWGDA
jgi:hypothetical protein